MKKLFSYYISVILLVLSIGQAIFIDNTIVSAKETTWPASPDIVGETAILLEPNTGTILYEKNIHKKMYPASITKIMTALLTLENCKMDDIVVFSKRNIESIGPEDANIGCQVGEKMTIKDCLYALMLASANESATALAEHIAGDIDTFADLMNDRAKKAGAINTHFANPNGLHDKNHYVTAYDMAMIMKAAIGYPAFLDIIHSTEYTIPTNNKRKTPYPSYQRHKMVFTTSEYYDADVVGGKTGYTDEAGKTLVTYAKRGNMDLICVVLKSNGDVVFDDTRKLLDYGFDNFKFINVSENDKRFENRETLFLKSPFSTEIAKITIDNSANILIPANAKITDLDSDISFQLEDDAFASITYKYGDKILGTAKIKYLTSNSTTEKPSKNTLTTKPPAVNETKASNANDNAADTGSNKKTSTAKSKSNLTVILPIVIAVIILFTTIIVFAVLHRRKINQIRAMKRNRYR